MIKSYVHPCPSVRDFWGRVSLVVCLLFAVPLAADAQVKASLKIKRHAPWNLFDTGESVRFDAALSGAPAGTAEIEATLIDETGREVVKKRFQADTVANAITPVSVDMGQPGRGYYELRLTSHLKFDQGLSQDVATHCTLGVMEFVNRTAKEVRDGGYVFGLKWWGGIQNLREMEDALCKLGLQWTRIIQNERGKGPNRMTSAEILTEFPLNAVIKVERFPSSLYDEERYGPMDEWNKKYGRGSWVIKSLPKKEPYQQWLREQIAALPAEQQIFEIWNEAWDKLTPEDFAQLCGWIVEAITQDRPNAIIGPNLAGSTSPYEYDAKVIKAGGMNGMKMVALHPYGSAENRAWLREYKEWLTKQLGREVDIHITEYGSHSTPEGPARRSEMEQSRRVVRQSLALYAEGAKTLIPHWAGQTEKNPTYVEDWFGFVRKNEQPKPVLLAHANCARLIDGSRFVGDLWFGPRIEAIVFEKDGVHTLALWTLGEDEKQSEKNPPAREISFKPGSETVTVVDIMGRESKPVLRDEELTLTLGEAPLYVFGIGAELVKQASKELRPDRWPEPPAPPRNIRKAGKLSATPVLDGKFNDWKGAAELALVNPRVNGADSSGMGYLGWDEAYLYVGLDVRDNELLNKQIRKYLYREDGIEFFVSTEPRESGSGFGPNDYQFFMTPASGEGGPIIGVVTDRETGVLENVQGARFFAGPTQNSDPGWALEVALPWSELKGFKPKPGAKLAVEFMLNDADTSHPRFKILPVDAAPNYRVTDPSTWSHLVLE